MHPGHQTHRRLEVFRDPEKDHNHQHLLGAIDMCTIERRIGCLTTLNAIHHFGGAIGDTCGDQGQEQGTTDKKEQHQHTFVDQCARENPVGLSKQCSARMYFAWCYA